MVTCANVNLDGTAMVFATGYDWHKGIWGIGDKSNPELHGWMIKKSDCTNGRGY